MLTKILIELEIDEQTPGDARFVVDSILDAGVLQDAINDHDSDAGPLRVVSAIIPTLPTAIEAVRSHR